MTPLLLNDRRHLLQAAGALSLAGLMLPAARAAMASDAGTASVLAEAMAALGSTAARNPAIKLEVPEIAEDGAVVPVSIACTLQGAREMLILVGVNPEPLALRFAVPEGTEPFVATRIRMASSGRVIAAVRTADGTLHAVARDVQVTVGGCG